MNDVDALFSLYRHKGILIDTNILLLYFVGSTNRARITKFNRTQTFLPEDYDLLVGILNYFNQVFTTPNILTEVNSLANQLGEPERTQCLTIFAQGISIFTECYLESKSVASAQDFTRFGLTDCSILNLAKNQYLVLTDDLKLASHLQQQGIDTVNFNHIRVYGWK
jgi:rRNA-processing protein FCF1